MTSGKRHIEQDGCFSCFPTFFESPINMHMKHLAKYWNFILYSTAWSWSFGLLPFTFYAPSTPHATPRNRYKLLLIFPTALTPGFVLDPIISLLDTLLGGVEFDVGLPSGDDKPVFPLSLEDVSYSLPQLPKIPAGGRYYSNSSPVDLVT